MLALFSKLILKLSGWKVIYDIPPSLKQFVFVMAPHTSYWDFVIGRLALWSIRIRSFFLIKKESFFFPLGLLLKAMGGIPVNRSKSNNVVNEVSDLFKHNPDLIITITPEGTRSLRKEWKRGFWFIAKKARVPIVLGYLDYGKKIAGVHKMFYPGESYEKDLAMMYDYYRNVTAKHPEKFNLSPMYTKADS